MARLQTFAVAALVAVTGGGLARAVDLPPAPALPPRRRRPARSAAGTCAATSAPESRRRRNWAPLRALSLQGFRCRVFRPSRSPLSRTPPCPRPGRSTSASATSSIPGCGWMQRSNIASAASFARPPPSTIPRRPAPGPSAPPTASAEASRRSSRWSTATSISAISGARRPSSAPESASPTTRSPASRTRASPLPGRARSSPSAGSSPTPRGQVSPGR